MPKRPLPEPGQIGETYLIHLNEPVAHARHYAGWHQHPDGRRNARHASGNGARLLAVAKARGITWQVVRTWPGTDRRFERRLKNYAQSPLLCPVCNERGWQTRLPAPEQEN